MWVAVAERGVWEELIVFVALEYRGRHLSLNDSISTVRQFLQIRSLRVTQKKAGEATAPLRVPGAENASATDDRLEIRQLWHYPGHWPQDLLIQPSKITLQRHDRRFRQKCQIRNHPHIPYILTQQNGLEPPIDMSNRHCRRIRYTFSVRLDRKTR